MTRDHWFNGFAAHVAATVLMTRNNNNKKRVTMTQAMLISAEPDEDEVFAGAAEVV